MKTSDQQLLALLQDNARRSTSDLARALGLSRSTVQGKIDRLEKQGIIQGYSVVLGAAYEQGKVSAHVLIKLVQKLTLRTTRELQAMPATRSLFSISGDYDMIAIVQADSTESLSRILDEIADLEGVERTNSSVILETKVSR
jgi:DNA-binding Lrp family transcriptional regulator